MTNALITTEVTSAQISKCIRVIDDQTKEVFYRVESEDGTDEYTVRALNKQGRWYPTCTCKAGQRGMACKHVRWAHAHAQEYKRLQKTESRFEMSDIIVSSEYHLTEYRLTTNGGSVVQKVHLLNGSLVCGCDEFFNQHPCSCKHVEFVKAYLDQFHAEYEQWAEEMREKVEG